jgi:hypothetical protein
MSEIPPSPVLPTLLYATPDPNRLRRRLTTIGIVSICIGSLSFLFNGSLTLMFTRELSRKLSQISYYDRALAQAAAASAAAAKTQQQAATQPAPRSLTPTEIAAVITTVQLQCKNAMNPAQALALSRLLSTPSQKLIDPTIPLDSLGTPANHDTVQLIRAGISKSGGLVFRSTHGTESNQEETYCTLTIDSAGIVQRLQVASPTGTDFSTPSKSYHRSRFLPPSGPSPAYSARLKASVPAYTFATTVAAVHLLIAILLFAAGISLLTQRPRAFQLHRMYAFTNPLACLATVAAFLWILQAEVRPTSPLQVPYGLIATLGVPGCIYPITLLILFRREPQDTPSD